MTVSTVQKVTLVLQVLILCFVILGALMSQFDRARISKLEEIVLTAPDR